MKRSIVNVLLHSLFLAGIVYILWNPYNDGDIWWHIAAGKEILATFAIPQTDEWSFTSNGARPVYHSWLGGVLFAIIWQTGGLVKQHCRAVGQWGDRVAEGNGELQLRGKSDERTRLVWRDSQTGCGGARVDDTG